MNLNRILINESEKQRILGLHSSKKQLIIEAVTKNEMPICVRNAGAFSIVTDRNNLELGRITVKNAGGKGLDYNWYHNHTLSVNSETIQPKFYKYYCKCVEGKCKPKTYSNDSRDIPDECDDKKNCSLQTPGGQVGETPGGKVDVNCKTKSPYNAFTDAGLNWKEESRKWIEAKCNGTTPCILGNAQTNINLRNAFCDGTWGSQSTIDDGGQKPVDGGNKLPDFIPPLIPKPDKSLD